MNRQTDIIFKALGISLAALLTFNVWGALFKWFEIGTRGIWSLGFTHGAVDLNGMSTGMTFGSEDANVLMLVVFLFAFFHIYRKRQLSLK